MEASHQGNKEHAYIHKKRIKIFRDESLRMCELLVNEFLIKDENIELIDIKELRTPSDWSFLVIYGIKNEEKK